MPNNQAHDTRTTVAEDRVAAAVSLSVAGVAVPITQLINEQFTDDSGGYYRGVSGGGQLIYENGYVRGIYPDGSDGVNVVISLGIPLSENISDIYIETRARMPFNRGGFKFLKIFGESDGTNYANTTLACVYGDGKIAQVSFGDGSSIGNDTANVINLSGANPDWIGRSYPDAEVSTPQNSAFTATDWGTDWHVFKFRVKFNSGTTAENEVADGAYFLSIDDIVYVDATGLFNRHYSNGPIEALHLFDYAQGNPEFHFDYDYVKVSTGGFL